MFAALVYNKRNHPPPNIPEYTPFPRNAGLFWYFFGMTFRPFIAVSISQIVFQHSSVALELRLGPNIFL
jgi:hypothetical protein